MVVIYNLNILIAVDGKWIIYFIYSPRNLFSVVYIFKWRSQYLYKHKTIEASSLMLQAQVNEW